VFLVIGVVTEKIIYYRTWKILFSHPWLFPPSPSQYSDFVFGKKFERIPNFWFKEKIGKLRGEGEKSHGGRRRENFDKS
jgi:hypothetical protein